MKQETIKKASMIPLGILVLLITGVVSVGVVCYEICQFLYWVGNDVIEAASEAWHDRS